MFNILVNIVLWSPFNLTAVWSAQLVIWIYDGWYRQCHHQLRQITHGCKAYPTFVELELADISVYSTPFMKSSIKCSKMLITCMCSLFVFTSIISQHKIKSVNVCFVILNPVSKVCWWLSNIKINWNSFTLIFICLIIVWHIYRWGQTVHKIWVSDVNQTASTQCRNHLQWMHYVVMVTVICRKRPPCYQVDQMDHLVSVCMNFHIELRL